MLPWMDVPWFDIRNHPPGLVLHSPAQPDDGGSEAALHGSTEPGGESVAGAGGVPGVY